MNQIQRYACQLLGLTEILDEKDKLIAGLRTDLEATNELQLRVAKAVNRTSVIAAGLAQKCRVYEIADKNLRNAALAHEKRLKERAQAAEKRIADESAPTPPDAAGEATAADEQDDQNGPVIGSIAPSEVAS